MIQSASTPELQTEFLRRIAHKPYFESTLGTHLHLFGNHPASGWAFYLLPGAAYAYAGGDSKDPKAVAEAILDEAQRLAAEGVDGDYYKRIVNANFGAALRELNAFESIAVSMAEGRFQGYDPYRFPEIYDDITAEDVRAFLRENFTRAHMALSVIAPKEG